MAVRNKIFIPNEIYFITFTILGWKKIFTNDKYCDLVYKWFDYMKEKFGAKHKVFKDGYDSKIIQNQKFFLEKLKYVHNNPCVEKWQLADAPENCKHSSANNYILGKWIYDIDLIQL